VNGVETDLDWKFAAVLTPGKQLAPCAPGEPGHRKVTVAKAGVLGLESLGNKHLDG
jgi:hypothetical protein